MYKIGDYVRVIKTHYPPQSFLVGKCATVTESFKDGVWLEFDNDEEWADDIYFATADEIELEE